MSIFFFSSSRISQKHRREEKHRMKRKDRAFGSWPLRYYRNSKRRVLGLIIDTHKSGLRNDALAEAAAFPGFSLTKRSARITHILLDSPPNAQAGRSGRPVIDSFEILEVDTAEIKPTVVIHFDKIGQITFELCTNFWPNSQKSLFWRGDAGGAPVQPRRACGARSAGECGGAAGDRGGLHELPGRAGAAFL